MISEFAVKRWQLTLVVFLSLAVLGVHALVQIPKNADPTFPFPIFNVIAVLPGATPVDVERLVVDPVEARIKALEDVKALKTEIHEGLAVVRVDFEAGVDADQKRDDVLREINALRPTLPSELRRLDVKQTNSANVNILVLGLVSDSAPYKQLGELARSLRRRIENVSGVRSVEIAGLPDTEVRADLDASRLVALQLSPLELAGAIRSDSSSLPAGTIELPGRQLSVKTTGEYTSVDEIRDTIVRSGNGGALRVRDVANVRLADAEPKQITRLNGRRSVLITAAQQENEDIFRVRAAIGREIDAFSRTLPKNVAFVRGFDQTETLRELLNAFALDFGLAVLLVLVTLLPLGLRAAAVVVVSIPLSLAIGLALLRACGFTLNQLSIVGFVIALGLLVDDSVVVVENITRHLREGQSPRHAAISATREITASVLGCTATLMFAFLPLLAMPGVPGEFIRSMPVAVLCTIGASLFVSLTIVPFLASSVLRPASEHGNAFLRLTQRGIDALYRPVLGRAIQYPITTVLLAAALVSGSLALVPSIGFSLFPKAQIPYSMLHIEAAGGASLGETDRAARFVESVLARHPEVVSVSTSVGKDHPQVYYNVVPKNEKANVADVFVGLRHSTTQERAALYAAIRKEVAAYSGARIELEEFAAGPAVEAPIALRIIGESHEALAAAGPKVRNLLASIPGTRDVRNQEGPRHADLRVRIDREKAALLGVRLVDIEQAVRFAVSGILAGRYREESAEESYDIRLALPYVSNPGQSRPGLQVLEDLHVPNRQGTLVPLALVATLELASSPASIRHYGRERCATVTAHVREGFNTNRLTNQVLQRLQEVSLPPGVRIVPGGEYESRRESFAGVGVAILVAVFGIMAILVLEFRAFRSVLIVASVIPLGVVGGLVALYFSDYTLSFTATIGFVALLGIEIKNSILLVDCTNQLRASGVELDEAIERAASMRFLPVLLTSLTAIGGLIPLVVERSSLYSPLALVIVGGLISSTVLARIVTPVLYKLFAPEVVVEPAPEPRSYPAPPESNAKTPAF